MRRRTALKALASASVGLSAGCLGGEDEPGTATSRTSATATRTMTPATETGENTTTEAVETTTDTTSDATETTTDATEGTQTTRECPPRGQPVPTCGEEWTRLNAATFSEVSRGTAGGFELTADPTTLALGDCVTFRLTNRNDEKRVTGIKEKYDVHRKTADGWQSVLFSKRRGYSDLGMRHRPGEGFVWKRRLSQAGLSGHSDHRGTRACEPLEPGTYRFVYWGGAGHFDAIAAEFEVTE